MSTTLGTDTAAVTATATGMTTTPKKPIRYGFVLAESSSSPTTHAAATLSPPPDFVWSTHLSDEHNVHIWATIAKRSSYVHVHLRWLWWQYIVETILFGLLFLSFAIVVPTARFLYPGACFEQQYPLAYDALLLTFCYLCETGATLVWFSWYTKQLVRWHNPLRWYFRAVESALITVFINGVTCQLDIPTLIMASIFYIGGVINFSSYEPALAKSHAARQLRAHWLRRNNVTYKFVKSPSIQWTTEWFRVFLPFYPVVFLLWVNFGLDPNAYLGLVTDDFWIIYIAGLVQSVSLIALPISVHRSRSDCRLFRRFLYTEHLTSAVLTVTKLFMFITYLATTRTYA